MALVCDGTSSLGIQTQVWSDGHESIIGGASACSGAIWIRINSWGSATNGDVVANISGTAAQVVVAPTSGQVTLRLRTGGGICSFPYTPTVGVWFHFAFTHDTSLGDGKRQKLYVNGAEVQSTDFNNSVNSGAEFGPLGPASGDDASYSYHWPAAWNVAISAAAVADLATDTKPQNLAATPAYYFDFSQQTVGVSHDSDTGFASSNTSNCPHMVVREGWPTWNGDDPLGSDAPILVSTIVSRQLRQVASGSTTNLGNLSKEWPDSSTSAAFDIHYLNNGGGDDLTGISVSLSNSNATIVNSLPTTLQQGEAAVLRIALKADTTGSKSVTITIESDQLADHTLTLNWHVRSDADTNIEVGSGFVAIPTESPTAHGSGVSYKIAAEVDVPDLLHVRANTVEFCGLWSHDDIAGLDKLEVYFEQGSVSATLYNNRKSSRTGLQGVTGTLDNSGGSPGTRKAYFRFVPVNGKERLLQRSITFNGALSTTLYVSDQGSDASGDGSSGNPYLTVEHALQQLSAEPGVIKCMAGATGRIQLGTVSIVRNHTYCSIVELDSGLDYGDVELYLSSPGVYESKHRKVQFENLRFDLSTILRFRKQTSDAQVNFVNCGFFDLTDGAGGPPVGRHTFDVGANGSPPAGSQLFMDTTFQVANGGEPFGLVGVREWVGYTGPTGNVLVCGGLGGDHLIAEHGGDHGHGFSLFGGVGWRKATGVEALIRYTDSYFVRAGAVSDLGGGSYKLNLSSSPYLDVASMLAESTARVRVESGSLIGTRWPITDADNANSTITITGDSSVLTLGSSDDLLVVGLQHSDLAQHNFQNSPDGNAIMQAVDARDINGATQMRLPQKVGSVGEVEAWAMQLVAYNQKVDNNLGYQEENETNSRFDHCTFANANFTNTTGASCTACTMANTVTDLIARGWSTVGVVSQSGALSVPGLSIVAAPDYNQSLRPTLNGNLKGAVMPLLPYDLAGNARSRGGGAYIGAYEVIGVIPP